MPALMGKVILDKITQRDRGIVANRAERQQPVLWNGIHHGGQNLVLYLPPAEKRFPRLGVIAVGADPRVLRILWAFVVPVDDSAHEALAIIGGGVRR